MLKRLFLLFLSTLTLAGCGYTFNKIFNAGRVRSPLYGMFPYKYSVGIDDNVYFSMNMNGDLKICKLDTSTGNVHVLIDKGNNIYPVVSDDGKQVYYMHYSDERFCYDICRTNTDGSVQDTILKNNDSSMMIKRYFVNSTNTKLYIVGSRMTDELYNKQHWTHYSNDFYEFDIENKKMHRLSKWMIGCLGNVIYNENNNLFYCEIVSDENYIKKNNKRYNVEFSRKPFANGYYKFYLDDNRLEKLSMKYIGNISTNSDFNVNNDIKIPKHKNYVISSNKSGLYKMKFEEGTILDFTGTIDGKPFDTLWGRIGIENVQFLPESDLMIGLVSPQDIYHLAILDPETKQIVKSFPWDSLTVIPKKI